MNKYSLSMRIMHWLVSIMIITLLCVGTYMVGLPVGAERMDIYTMHKSFGLIAFMFILIRIVVRLRNNVPALPDGVPHSEAKYASWVTALFYICMVLMPISGYVMSMASGYGINFLGTGHMVPNLLELNGSLASRAKGMHGLIAWMLATLILVHIIGAIKHLVVDKVNLFKRMI